MSSETQVMSILEKYFKTKGFIAHQISSYNHMIQHSLQEIVGEESVIDVEVKPNVKYRVEFGQVHIGKPQVIEEDRTVRNLYPAESRLRNDTYNSAIALDIVTFLTIDGVMKETKTIDKYIIGHIPVMVNSSKCNLYGLSKQEKIAAGECPEDEGGYFIIGGKERVLITQERAAYNMIGVHKQKAQSKYSYVSEVRSMSDTTGHSVLVQAKISKNNRGICFSLPYINYEIPVGVVFKALGFEVRDFPYLLGVSLHTRKFFKVIYEEMGIATQGEALGFIGKHAMHVIQQDKRAAYASQILENEIFPHMGVITHSLERAMFLGALVKKLLETASESGIRPCDDRDNIANKRFEVAGVLVSSLFRSLFKRLVRSVTPLVQKRPDITIALSRFNTVTTGFRSCFATGKWGVQKNSYVRQGVSQVLSRLTLGAFRSHLRRIVIPIGKEGKNTQIRQLHGSQIFFICLFETPEGHASGIVKNFSMTCEVTNGINGSLAREVIEKVGGIIAVVDIGDDISILADAVRIYLNGNIIGITEDPTLICTTLRDLRDKRHIPHEASISYDDIDQEIHIATDSGRLIRPLFSLDSGNKLNVIDPDTTWYEMVDEGIIKYRDAAELENMVIAMEPENLASTTEYDLLEIHPSMMMGVCASIIPFPDHSQSPRNCYQCLEKTTPILMSNGEYKQIQHVKVGEQVVSVDPKTMNRKITTVINQYVKPTNKEMFKLETITGRNIVCTYDHPILSTTKTDTVPRWVQASKLTDDHLVAVCPELKYYTHENDVEKTILTVDMFTQKLLSSGVKESLVRLHCDKLQLVGLLPLKNSHPHLPLIAGIIGFLMTDGSSGIYSSTPQIQLSFGSEKGSKSFMKDVSTLGFSTNKCVYHRSEVHPNEWHSVWQTIYNNEVASLFISLGVLLGKKTTQHQNKLLSWIKHGSMAVKRSFLSAFQGGDGCKIRCNKLKGRKSPNYVLNVTMKQKEEQYKDSLVNYMTDVKHMFEEFGIVVKRIHQARVRGKPHMFNVGLVFECSRDNIMNYYENIGYKYDHYKTEESLPVYEYLKYQKTVLEKTSMKRLSNNFISYQEWLDMTISVNNSIFVPVNITHHENVIISDITVDDDVHSFITGSHICVHNSAMGKQALGIYALSNAVRADTIVHLLNSPQAPLTTTKIASFMGFDKLPSGQNIMVAIATYTGFNQEDSIIMNKGAIDRGIFRVTTFKTVSHVEKKKGTAYNESIQFPPADIRKRFYKYDKLGDDGIAKVGQKVEKNDVLIGRVLRYTNKQGETEYKDCSTVAKINEAGIIDKVIIGTTPEGFEFIKVKIRSTCIPEVGDKLASKSAQKGTIGAIYASHDMPFTEDGLIPDIIINPHCLSGDSVIRLSTGEVKYIKDIYDKDCNITTVNPETLEISNTKYNQGFVKDTVEMKELTTISGRKIKCTPEHKFLVVVGEEVVWKEAKDILPYSDKMLIHHSILPVAETKENELIIQAPVDTRNKYWTRLSDLGYVGVAISLEKKMILARLLGITDSDGHLRIRNKTTGSMRYKIYVGELEDIVEIQNDVKTLGFKIPIYHRSQWTFDVELEPALGFLMYQIGTCIGNKTKSLRVFPQWIKNACLSVKREFLSGYQGGDGSKVGVNLKMPQQQVRIHPIPMRTMNDEHIKSSHMGYLKEFQQVYKEFGIEATIQEYKTKSDDKTDLKLYISTTEANIEKFISTVGYRYCNHKRRESRLPIEYFKTKNNGIKFEYQKFKDCFQHGDLITTFIETNVDIPPEPVYDFTTSSENHSFIANSFVSHNCIPSRMTINQLIESLGSMLTTIDGERRDATAFTSNSTNIVDKIQEELLRAGLNPNGECRMRNGFTGDMMDAHIFMGPTYYQRLKHMVKDKMHARAHGDCQVLTRQPLEGRSRDGGLRFGEMERDASLAHGTAAFLKERLLEMSDYFEVDVCTDCRQISKAGQCMFCGKDNIVRVQLPYACKLLFHELQSMCLKIDLLTE